MGYFRGRIDGDSYIVTDAFPLPVEGTETRVNANQAAEEYTGQIEELCEHVHQLSNIVTQERRSFRMVPLSPQLRSLVIRNRRWYLEEHANDGSYASNSY